MQVFERLQRAYDRRIMRLVNLYVETFHKALVKTFRDKTGRAPRIAWPRTIEDKILWRKIFDHNPLFPTLQDKLLAQDFTMENAPDFAMPEIYWAGTDITNCPPEILTKRAVLKPNHSCARLLFLPAQNLTFEQIKRRSGRWLKHRYGKKMGEWAYQHIHPKLFIEELLENHDASPLVEIKVHICMGKAILSSCFSGRFSPDPSVMMVLPDGSVVNGTSNSSVPMKPTKVDAHFKDAIEMAEKLGRNLDYIRVDMYVANGKIYLGELTIYPFSGFPGYRGVDMGPIWSKAWDLRKSWFLSQRQFGWRGVYARALFRTLERQSNRLAHRQQKQN